MKATRRNTIQKNLVLEAAHCLNHPTAEEIYRTVTAAHPHVSKGTVYRNLGQLVDQGTLRKIASSGADHFDTTLHGHYHLYCTGCGRMVDADLPYQEDLTRNIRDTGGFVIQQEHDIILRGLCPSCQRDAPSQLQHNS